MRMRRVLSAASVLVVCALTAAACSSSSGSSNAAASTGTAPTTTAISQASTAASVQACHRAHKSGQFSQSFVFQGKTRTYQLYVPAAYKGTTRVPLVFNFHGFGSNAVQQMTYADFNPLADEHNFLIVAPDGQGSGAGRHFVFGNEPGLQNDVLMVQALLNHIEATLCVDARRVYSTGMSDGGAMTSVLACTLPNKFAAFAPVAVVLYCGSAKSRPVAIEGYSGTADPVVPYNGGAVHCCGGAVLPSKPVSMAKWAAHDKCNPKFTDVRVSSQVRRRTWTGCTRGGAVVFYIIIGGGHTWPGAVPIPRLGLTSEQIKASDLIWKFFAAHKLAT
jgi:polyhydroxybutyrate depolymerase